jgi:hypothetical protein
MLSRVVSAPVAAMGQLQLQSYTIVPQHSLPLGWGLPAAPPAAALHAAVEKVAVACAAAAAKLQSSSAERIRARAAAHNAAAGLAACGLLHADPGLLPRRPKRTSARIVDDVTHQVACALEP